MMMSIVSGWNTGLAFQNEQLKAGAKQQALKKASYDSKTMPSRCCAKLRRSVLVMQEDYKKKKCAHHPTHR